MEENINKVITGEEKAIEAPTLTDEKVDEDASKDNMDISNSQPTLKDHSDVGKTETGYIYKKYVDQYERTVILLVHVLSRMLPAQ